MTLEEALDISHTQPAYEHASHDWATGSDGEYFYVATRAYSGRDEPARPVLMGRCEWVQPKPDGFGCWVDAYFDPAYLPEGVDWVPGYHPPDPPGPGYVRPPALPPRPGTVTWDCAGKPRG